MGVETLQLHIEAFIVHDRESGEEWMVSLMYLKGIAKLKLQTEALVAHE